MQARSTTHADAVYLARALNLNIETVWETVRHLPASSFADLESTVRLRLERDQETTRKNMADASPL